MNNEMMLHQARQDFIDLHQEMINGREVTLLHYDQIAQDLRTMDEANFEQLLHYIGETEKIPIQAIWREMSGHIAQLKDSGNWTKEQDNKVKVLFHRENNHAVTLSFVSRTI